ncbi:MAG TPA: hypothetical protein VK581_09050 [Chthoniobacterales bacterium]|nr:hypothetical protein [Chthoniobacterales bacterium]
MKTLCLFGFFVALTTARLPADDFLDDIENALTINAFQGTVRTQLSGFVDLEIYRIDLPPPGLIDADRHFFLNPRLSLFLDAQFGTHVYLFVQSRVDRDFDPHDHGAQIRLDEYALRFNPRETDCFDLQIGKFATVIGNFVQRHLSWENPFVTAPLPYEHLTAASDAAAPAGVRDFVSGFVFEEDKNNPLIWGPSYATGGSVAGQIGKFNYALEVKNSALASRPKSWDASEIGFSHPTVSGRIGFRPDQAWNFGVSASDGSYFRPEAGSTLPPGRSIGDYREILFGQDISYAFHHLQFWAEFYEVRFQVPRVGNADTFAYYLEGKYKFTPQFFGALRWNQQLFATVPDGIGGSARWGHDLWRIDTSLGYRFTAHTQLKLQYSFQDENSDSRDLIHTLAAQFTVRF